MEEKKITYHDEAPYPPIQVCAPNRAYGLAMLDNQSGMNSEMSAVSLYFYDHLITGRVPEVADTFHQIGIVEMHHLEIFGRLSLLLGMDPRLWSQDGRRRHTRYWSPGYNRYHTDLLDIISHAIRDERGAVQKYTEQTRWINDAGVVANLQRIILDEQLHIRLLTELLEHCLRPAR